MGEITTEIVHVTPERALVWLGRNTGNRTLNERAIDRFAEAILRGEWELNGEALKFARDGRLLDGQTRLHALLRAAERDPSASFRTLVIWDVSDEAQQTMDSGRKRTLADNLAMRGETNTHALAAALNRLHLWEVGEVALRNTQAYNLTTQQAVVLLEQNPHIREAVKASESIIRRIGGPVPKAVIAACVYRFHELDARDSIVFWRQVADGVGLAKTDATWQLRRALQANATRKQKYPPLVVHALIIKAWNAYRQGRQVENLSWRAGGAAPEKFPEPV